MAQTRLGERVVNTSGELPTIGSKAPDFVLANTDWKDVGLQEFSGKNVVLNIFPTIDTSVCSASIREFNKRATALPETVVLCISKDLPLAQKKFCGAEGIENVVMLSDFRSKGFSKNYGVELIDGGWYGLLARSVVVIDKEGKVKHTELVAQIGQEPDYDAAVSAIS
jgi:thioredoxin-dependent peroxiredoxin